MSGFNLDDPNFVGNIQYIIIGNPDDPQTSLSGEGGAFSTVLIPLGSWESKPQITDGPPGFGGGGLAPHISLRLGLGGHTGVCYPSSTGIPSKAPWSVAGLEEL